MCVFRTIWEVLGESRKYSFIIYLPIYMSYLLKEPKIEQLIVNLDISGL